MEQPALDAGSLQITADSRKKAVRAKARPRWSSRRALAGKLGTLGGSPRKPRDGWKGWKGWKGGRTAVEWALADLQNGRLG